MKYLLTIFLLLVSVSICASSNIFFEKNKLTLQVSNSSLLDTLNTVQKLTGIEFVVTDDDIKKDKISTDFQGIDIEIAINRLLKSYNKSMEYDELRRLKKVYLLARTIPSSSPSPDTIHEIKREPNGIVNDSQDLDNTTNTDSALMNNEPDIVVIEDHPQEMRVEPPTNQDNIPGIVEDNVGEMEVSLTFDEKDAPGMPFDSQQEMETEPTPPE